MGDAYAGQVSPDGRWRWDGTAWRPAGAAYPAWARLDLRAGATWAMLAGAAIVGLLADQALRTATFGAGAALTVAAAAVLLAFTGRLETLQSRALAGAAAAFGLGLAVRASPWLVWPDAAGSLALLGLAASLGQRGSLLNLGVAEAGARTVHAIVNGFAGAPFIAGPVARTRLRLAPGVPIARGMLIAAPIAVLLAALLAAADPVFASFLNLNLDFGQLALDGLFVLAGTLVAAGLLRLASAEAIDRVDGPRWRLGAIEGLVVLAVLDGIFAAFAVAQAVAAAGAAGETLRAAGITYSDYARSGFFELLWVAGITAVVLVVFSRITGFSDRRLKRSFVVLAEIAVALTLLIVLVAFRRLSLYEEAFGFTMLRLYSHVFAGWIALVFVLLAVDIGGVRRNRRWFVGATTLSAAAMLFLMNVVNPEAVVTGLNVDHARTSHKLDSQYLAQLSSDAVPSLLGATSQLDPGLRSQVLASVCAGPRAYSPAPAAYNQSDADAAAARKQRC